MCAYMYVQICRSVYSSVKAKGCCCCLSVSLSVLLFFKIFFKFLFIGMCVCVSVYESMSLCICHMRVESRGGWKRALDPLELMSQVAVSHPAQVLELNLISWEKQQVCLTVGPFLSPVVAIIIIIIISCEIVSCSVWSSLIGWLTSKPQASSCFVTFPPPPPQLESHACTTMSCFSYRLWSPELRSHA